MQLERDLRDLETGTAHLFAGRIRDAIAVLRRSLVEPTHAGHHNLAVALRASGDVETALSHATAAASLAPCGPTLALVASLQRMRGDHEAALATLRHARAVDPAHDVTRYYLGIALAAAGDLEGALAELRHVASEVSRAPSGLRGRAELQIRDLLAADSPIAFDLCSIPLVTELVGHNPKPGDGPLVFNAPEKPEDGPRFRGEPDQRSPSSELVGRTTVAAAGPIDLAETRALIRRSSRVVALTGAGISAASGLATRKELWQRFDRDNAVSIAQFRNDPRVLWSVIREFLRDGMPQPNAAHHALAALPLAGIVTQNVEGLHQAAGPCPVLELHGTLLATRCDQCGARPGLSCLEVLDRMRPDVDRMRPDVDQGARADLSSEVLPADVDQRARPGLSPLEGLAPRCTCGSVLRPDVVLFGEWVDPLVLSRAADLVASCDLLLVIGTAADVAPAAELPLLAARHGATVIELKRQPSRLSRAGIAHHLAGTAEELLPQLLV